MKKNNYIGNIVRYCMLIVHIRYALLLKCVLIILCVLSELNVIAADDIIVDKGGVEIVYDEIPVRVMVQGFENFYLDAIYTDKKILYINVGYLLKTLDIPCTAGQNGNSLSGYIGNKSQTYLIDYDAGQIKVGNKIMILENGLLKDKGALYLESSLFAETFGITLNFNYRALSIILKSDFELPAIKQQRIERMRTNLSKIKGEELVDSIVKRNYHLMRFGMIDWAVGSTQTGNGTTDNQFALGIGAELLYGEADVMVHYYDRQKFDNRQLYYLWRWVDNDKKFIKQAQLGTISTQTISFINSPVIGATIRNTPTTVRRASGYYSINEFTEPNWNVELYINNVMVDYTKADASGLYAFKVPIVYGYTTLKLKFYGPLGEERTEERTMNVPYTVMAAKEFEYGVSTGMVQDSSSNRFGKGEFNYGVNRFLTVGGGVEYLSSITNGAYIPFLTATMQPFNNLTLNAEYAHGVRTRGLINYYFKRDILLELDYTKYVTGQLATRMNAPEERKARLSIPLRYKMINGYVKFDYTQLVYKNFNYNQSSVIMSAYYKQISANSSTQINWIDHSTPYVISDLALLYRMGMGYSLRPTVQFNANKNEFTTYKVALEKYIPKGYFSISYERNVPANTNLVNVSFKYDLSFARTNVSASQRKGRTINSETHQGENTMISESAQGSLAFGSGNKYIYKNNNTSVGKGGISLYSFLDLNHNSIFDKGEPMVKLTSCRLMGGKIILSEKDSIVRIADLTAFTKYILEFNDNDLQNISLRFKKKRYEVLIDPNQFKRIYIPIVPVGEANGMVYLNTDNTLEGIGRVLVKFYNKKSNKVIAETLSEPDGYIDYLGFEPGEYFARVDSTQLSNLNYTAVPLQKEFTIKTLREGDIVSGIDFILNQKTEKTTPQDNRIYTKPEFMKQISASFVSNYTQKNLKQLKLMQPSIIPVIKVNKKQKMMSPWEQDIPITLKNDSLLIKSTIASELGKEPNNVKQIETQKPFVSNINNLEMIVRDTMIYVSSNALYDVQLFSSVKQIKVEDLFTQLLASVPKIRLMETLGKDGLYHYSTGSFMLADEAREYLRFIRERGWKNGYVSRYAGGKRKVITFSTNKNIK